MAKRNPHSRRSMKRWVANKVSYNGRRFYTARDMAIVKHDIEVRNSVINRGELVPKGKNEYIVPCGCGATGCFIHGSYPNVEKKE